MRGSVRGNSIVIAMVAAALVWMTGSCAHDEILPVPAPLLGRCGDGEVIGAEECDSESEGCVQCQVATGWQCPDNVCAEVCGDQEIVGNEDCDPPDGLACDDSCHTATKNDACNMAGYWIVRQTDFSRDTLVSVLQPSSNWYVYQFSQDGNVFATEKSLYCGLEVSGTVSVRPRLGGHKALLYSNVQDGSTGRPARVGTFEEDGDHCNFTFERTYIIRGLEDSYLPPDFRAKPHMDDLEPPMPVPGNQEDIADASPEGVIDMDNDGRPGISWQITGIATGLRHSAQRDWNEYTTDAERWPIPAHAIEFTTRCSFDNEEAILFIEECGTVCGFLTTGSVPSQSDPSRVTFRYLGTDLTEARVAAVIGGPLYDDEAVDMETCEKVRAALPHDDIPEAKL